MKHACVFVLSVLLTMGCTDSRNDNQTIAPDNTGVNERDRNDAAKTAGDQSESEADRGISQAIREAVVGDDSLSTNGKNVKIITANGVVTLRGPVGNQAEKDKIAAKASQVAGVTSVDNQLEIAQ